MPTTKKLSKLLRVNWAHPLARGLQDCFIFGPAGNYGLVNLGNVKGHATFNASGRTATNWAGAPESGLHIGDDSTGIQFWNVPNYINYSAGDFTLFTRFVPITFLANGFNNVVVKGAGTEVGMWLDNTGNQNGVFVGNVSDLATYTTGFAVGKIANHGFTRALTGTTATYYANGKSIGSSATMGGTTADATANLTIGRKAGQNSNNQYILVYNWLRALSAAEMLQLHLDPYCFLIPADFVARPLIQSAINFAPLMQPLFMRGGLNLRRKAPRLGLLLLNKVGISNTTIVPLTGAAASSGAGTFADAVTSPLAGAAATSGAGTFAKAIIEPLTGAAASSGAGTFTPVAGVSLLGVGAGSGAGTFADAVTSPLAGAAATSGAGTFANAIIEPLTGAAATASAGNFVVTAGLVVNLTGAAAGSGVGTFANAITSPLAGAAASASAGTFLNAISVPLAGAGTVANAGSFANAITESLTGAAAVASAGSFAKAITEPLTGASATAAAGNFAVSVGGNTNVNLTGAAAGSGVGTFANAITSPLAGAGAIAAAGSIGAGAIKSLASAAASASAGTFLSAIAVPLATVPASANAGSFTPKIFQFTGAGAVASAGLWQITITGGLPPPPDRITHVAAESRVAIVAGESRIVIVPAQARIVFIT